MAGAHRFAIDYIEQAPVIVLAAAHGNAHVSWSERAFIQDQLRKVCESKAQLRDVMRSYGLPLPLRLLDARVLTARRATVIRRWRMPGWIYCGDWVCGGRESCGSSWRSTAGSARPVASGCEAKGLEKELSEKRVCLSALQPAKPTDISVSTATCAIRRERSNSAIRDMVTHSYATKCCFE